MGVESGQNGHDTTYWPVDRLMERVYPVHLANTAAIQQYEGLRYTDDDSNAPIQEYTVYFDILAEQLDPFGARRSGVVLDDKPYARECDSQR
jgi:hypothetical protein